jgi:hypothetical protein
LAGTAAMTWILTFMTISLLANTNYIFFKGKGEKTMKIDAKELENIFKNVKEDPSSLKGVPMQSFEICVAAIQAAATKDDVDQILKWVDPEFRTAALLKKSGIDAGNYGDKPFGYRKEWDPADVSAVICLYGKCSAKNLEAAQKILRRCLEGAADSWDDVWQGNPFGADFYEVEFFPDKNYFAMEFRLTEFRLPAIYRDGINGNLLKSFQRIIFNNFWDASFDFPSSVIEELELFYSLSYENFDFCGCGYCIEKLVDDDFDNLVVAQENWDFRLDDDKSRNACDARNGDIRERLALWLLEG